MSKTKSKTAFVFGSHPSALITALQLQSQDYAVTLFDSGDTLTKENFTITEVDFWENNERTKESITTLQRLLQTDLHATEMNSTPLMISAEKVSDFVGFGDKKYSSLPAISQLNQRTQLKLNLDANQIYELALQKFNGEIKGYSKVTQIDFSDDAISGVQINGNKTLSAELYAFTQTPKTLLDLLPDEVVSTRMRTKIARTEVYGRLSLKAEVELMPDEISELKNINTFMIPHAADFEPCVGSLSEASGVWHSFINSEFAEDPEKLAGQVRHMRKLVQKALPSLEQQLKAASISFEKEDYATYESEMILANLLKSNKNMLCTSPLWSTSWGLAGATEALMMNLEIRNGLMPTIGNDEDTKSQPTSLDSSI